MTLVGVEAPPQRPQTRAGAEQHCSRARIGTREQMPSVDQVRLVRAQCSGDVEQSDDRIAPPRDSEKRNTQRFDGRLPVISAIRVQGYHDRVESVPVEIREPEIELSFGSSNHKL